MSFMPEQPRPSVEAEPKKERGENVEIRFTFVRHSQKSSGEVLAEEGELSRANLSEGGRERAAAWGDRYLKGRDLNKAYTTVSDRTRETLEEALKGAGAAASEDRASFFALPSFEGSKAFIEEYNRLLNEEKEKILAEEFSGKTLDQLTPDEQESVMERAEEPAIAWYLSYGNEKPDADTPSPTEQAQAVAWRMNRLVQLVDHVESGKRIDLLSVGHKTSTEAFLQAVLKELTVSLEEVGGSMKILDGWDLSIKTGSQDKKLLILTLRREDGATQEFELPEKVITNLSNRYLTATGRKR